LRGKILVTGGAGFIGSHLVESFLQDGFEVLCVDNFLTGSEENIKGFLNNPRLKLYSHDVRKPFEVKEKLSAILHFASPASPRDYLKYPVETMMVGALGTYNLLELAKEKKCVFLLASTSEVYGDPEENPQREDYRGNVNCIGERGVYDEAKRFGEALTMAYYRYYKVNTRIVRIFNTYGPRMREDDGRAIPTFIVQALKEEPLTVFGNGTQTRSFCYISDLIRGIRRLLEVDYHLPVNLGNPEEWKIIDLARLIVSLTGSRSNIVFRKLPQDDPQVRRPDITVAKKILGWEPQISLREGLEKTIQYFKERIS